MSDEVKFTARLVDKVTGNSRKIGRSLGTVERIAGRSSRTFGKSLGKDLRRFTRQGTLARKVITPLGKALDRSFGKKSAIRQEAAASWKSIAGGTLAAQAITKTLDLGAAAARATGEMVMFGERSRLALGQLGKHGASGEKLFELARTLTKRFGGDVVETTENLQKLLSSQFSAKLGTDIIKMGADLRSIGASADATHRAVVAITQIKGTGKLQGDELMQLAEAGISLELVRGEIGKLLGGKSTQEVIKLQTAGKIDADTAIQGILSAVQKKTGSKQLGDAGEKFAATTIEGMLGRGKALAQDAAIKITDRITGSLNKQVGGKLNRFWDWLESPAGIATVDRIGTTLDKAIGLAIGFGDAAAEGFSAVGDVLGPMLETIGGGDGQTAVMVAKSLGKAIGFVAGVAVAGGVAVGMLTAGVAFLAGAIAEGAIGAVDGFIGGVGDVILWLDDLDAKVFGFARTIGDKAMAIGTAIVDGIKRGIISLASAPIDALKSLGGSMIDAVKGAIDMHSPPRAFVDIGFAIPDAVAIGSTRNEARVTGAAENMADSFLGSAKASFSASSFDLPTFRGDTPTSFDSPSAASSGAAAAAGTSTSTRLAPRVSIPITIEGGGRGNEELAELASTYVRREVEAFFRQFDLEEA